MKVKVFVDGNFEVHSQEEVAREANEYVEDASVEMLEGFVKNIDSLQNVNPLFTALRYGDVDAFLKLSRKFSEFLDSHKAVYIDENYYTSYVEV